MESFIRGMVTQMRTDYIETSEDEDQVLEEADPEQEYDEEIAHQGYNQEVDEEDTARLEQYLDPVSPPELQQVQESVREAEESKEI